MVKRFLTEKNVDFDEVNLERHPEQAMQVFQTTGQRGVPQTRIKGEWVLGYDPNKIEKLLKTL